MTADDPEAIFDLDAPFVAVRTLAVELHEFVGPGPYDGKRMVTIVAEGWVSQTEERTHTQLALETHRLRTLIAVCTNLAERNGL